MFFKVIERFFKIIESQHVIRKKGKKNKGRECVSGKGTRVHFTEKQICCFAEVLARVYRSMVGANQRYLFYPPFLGDSSNSKIKVARPSEFLSI